MGDLIRQPVTEEERRALARRQARPRQRTPIVSLGLDVGQSRDPSALAVVEDSWRKHDGRTVCHHVARHLERLPLGTPYPAVADRVAAVVEAVRERLGSPTYRPTLAVDATGVGAPVVDLLRECLHRCPIVACYFTSGDRRTEGDHGVTIGKAWLVSRLQALLQTGRIHLPDTHEARVLAEELLDYEIRVSEDANDRYGAFKVGTHDDLVTALGLAVQKPRKRSLYPGGVTTG